MLDEQVMASAARLRARVLALVHGALRGSGLDQASLARQLKVRKSAVNALLHGNGNVRIDTLGEYLAALGYEADITAVPLGEIERSQEEGRSPEIAILTISDRHRSVTVQVPSDYQLFGVHEDRARKILLGAWKRVEHDRFAAELEPTRELLPTEIHASRRSNEPADAYRRKIAIS